MSESRHVVVPLLLPLSAGEMGLTDRLVHTGFHLSVPVGSVLAETHTHTHAAQRLALSQLIADGRRAPHKCRGRYIQGRSLGNPQLSTAFSITTPISESQ